jgi:putative ABC transport system ATP-binding protein
MGAAPSLQSRRGASLVISGLNMRYGSGHTEVHAIRDLSLRVARSEFLCIMGASGSGKSTLLHLIAGLREPTAGSIELDGVEMTALGASESARLRRREIGLVFQFFHLIPDLTVRQNAALPLLMDGVSMRSARPQVDDLLDRLELSDRTEHRLDQLSGGQLQRVAICRALVAAPSLILADEPTGNLDSNLGETILALLGDLCRERSTTTILVTHDARARVYADRTLQIEDGRILSEREDAP